MPLGFLLEIECQLRPETRREFTLTSTSLIPHTGEGHRRTVIYEDRNRPNHVLWVEEWKDRASVDKYLVSDVYLALQGALKTLGAVSSSRLIAMTETTLSGPPGVQPLVRSVGWTILDPQGKTGPTE